MIWRRVEPVQPVDALFIKAPDALERLARALADRPALGHPLVAAGETWAAVFAQSEGPAAVSGPVLPRLPDAVALWRLAGRWWAPIGWNLAAPEPVREDWLAAWAAGAGLVPPAIAIPAGCRADAPVDIYPVRAGRLALLPRRVA